MTRLIHLLALAVVASPATAQNSAFCQELWLSRNTVMDRAGHCFDTPLGQSVFDNAGCVPGDTRLGPLDAELVRLTLEVEESVACNIDTDTTQLDPGALSFRARLTELLTVPVRGDSEHGCHGYTGPPIALHTGISNSTTQIGTLEPGQSFGLSHWRLRGGWEYLEVSDGAGAMLAHGWTQDVPETLGDICDFALG